MEETATIFNSADYTWLWRSLIGIGGTLLGTFLGWLLSKRSNKSLKCSIKTDNYEALYDHPLGEPYDFEMLDCVIYYLDLFLFNPSDLTKTIRSVSFEAYGSHKKPLIQSAMQIFENGKILKMGNILPHHGIVYSARGSLYPWGLNKKDDIKKMYIVYLDENNKRRKIKCSLDLFKKNFEFKKPYPSSGKQEE